MRISDWSSDMCSSDLVLGLQRFELALRHRKRVVTEVDLAGVLVGLEHREIDDPTHGEPVRVDQVELLGDAGARQSRELRGDRFLAGGKEQPVVGAETQFGGQRVHLLRAVLLCDRPAPFPALARRTGGNSMPIRSLMSWSRRRSRSLRSEEHTSELQSLMRISYAVFCLKKKKK